MGDGAIAAYGPAGKARVLGIKKRKNYSPDSGEGGGMVVRRVCDERIWSIINGIWKERLKSKFFF